MKKLLVLLLLVFTVVLVVSCTPKEAAPETVSDTAAEEAPEELLGEEDSGAIAGQAINRGCRSRRVDSCVSNEDGSITVEVKEKNGRTRTKQYGAKCVGSRNAYTYRCREGGKPAYEYCRTQCEAGEQCSQGQCVALCGNGQADAGETCSSCAQDVVCAEGLQCENGACVAQAEQVNLCGNGAVDAGETCSTCAQDVVCPAGEQCLDGACEAQVAQPQPFCYYVNASGQRLQEGASFSLVPTAGYNHNYNYNYTGIVTEQGQVSAGCNATNSSQRIEPRCGVSWEYRSGPNVWQGDPRVVSCPLGCNSASSYCCRNLGFVSSSCEGAVLANSTRTDCGEEPVVTRKNCSNDVENGWLRSPATCYMAGDQATCVLCGNSICERNGVVEAYYAACADRWPRGEWVDTGRRVNGTGCPNFVG